MSPSRWNDMLEILSDPIRFNQEYGHRIKAWLELNPPDIPASSVHGKWFSDNFRQQAWTSYTPALTGTVTDPTLGSGSVAQGEWTRQADRTIHANIRIAFGTSGVSAGSGTYRVTMPVAGSAPNVRVIGHGYVFDSSTSNFEIVSALVSDVPDDDLILVTNSVTVTSAAPWTWAASDEIVLNLTYQAGS